ncbi:ParB/RepB/Spo0J family partition protein [Acidovorax sp. 56]|uniref:ParB/RepB/Spo0J family partition protein n=1 Tax=Acidovorax sp. 56 TaxID=2035205 RepID=UPI000C173863|nr:ParB/RepB/Spo0J family partition protein [Acidovorax sp. 56]PIF29389.1 ParB/RepB/Spo0J family partition protein [Acidovorax sp. 56]
MATKDPLIGRKARINDDATTLKGGKPHPQAGMEGEIIGKTPGGRQYQIQCGEVLATLPMADFTVLDTGKANAQPANNTLPLTCLVRSKTNRHIAEDEDLLEMAATMKLHGVLTPLLVRCLPAERLQDTFEDEATRHATHEIIAGERRFVAARIAGLRQVPVLVREADNTTAVVMQLIENLHRKDLNPLDEARGIQHLVDDFSLTRDAVADAIRKSRTHVFESLRLLTLCPEAIAAIKAGVLKRSVALLVAQRPTPALQTEYTKKVLTGGPDGGPLSHRSAKDLAQRNYMTDLTQAPFALDDAKLIPIVGSCMQCPKRTGANSELWDKAGADVCTDTACFADKKDAHYERLKADAHAKGRKIITGREARELMPTEGATPKGYILLDKPKKGSTEPMREVLGQEVPQGKVVLIETPTGGVVEAVPVRAAGEALQAKGAAGKADKKAPTRTKEELEDEYQQRWRSAAVRATIEGLRVDAEPESFDHLPEQAAYRVILTLARETDDSALRAIFQLPAHFDDDALEAAVRSAAQGAPRQQNMVLLMLAAAFDWERLYNRPADEALHLESVAPIAKVDIGDIKREVQQAMNAEAVERAAEADADAAAPADKAKPTLKPKGKGKTVDGTGKASKAEVLAGIAQAMQQAETPNNFTEGQTVKLKTNVKGPSGGMIQCKDHTATIVRSSGRKWVVTLLDPWPFPGKKPEPMELTVDYTELEAAQ